MKTGGRACITSGCLVGLFPPALFLDRGIRKRGALVLRFDNAAAVLRAFFFLIGDMTYVCSVCYPNIKIVKLTGLLSVDNGPKMYRVARNSPLAW